MKVLFVSAKYVFDSFFVSNFFLGMVDEGEYGAVSWGMKRSALEDTSGEPEYNSSLILAAKRTHRRDPLDNFKYYKGGWNISHKYYLSVSFGSIFSRFLGLFGC